MKIEVKQWHIDHGHKRDCQTCPIALAIAEKYPDARFVEVTRFNIHIEYNPQTSKKPTKHYKLPEKAMEFINNFDAGKFVEPFSFNTERYVS